MLRIVLWFLTKVKARTFAELYCEEHGIPSEQYSRHIFKRALYPHARLVAWFIALVDGDYFTPDRDLIQDAGRLTDYHDFAGSRMDYSHHPANRGFLRRVFLLRISSERMRHLVREGLKRK